MLEYLPAFLLAMAVLIVPASARYGGKKIIAKLDESRARDEANAVDLAVSLSNHRADLMKEILAIKEEVVATKEQTTATNGKVAEHDKQLTIVTAKQEVMLDMILQRQPDKGV